jgi:hypothetical protein
MNCMSCAHINLEQRPTMTNLGFSSCKFDGLGVYKSLAWERKCEKYAKAAAEIIEARQAQKNTTGSSQK